MSTIVRTFVTVRVSAEVCGFKSWPTYDQREALAMSLTKGWRAKGWNVNLEIRYDEDREDIIIEGWPAELEIP